MFHKKNHHKIQNLSVMLQMVLSVDFCQVCGDYTIVEWLGGDKHRM